MADKNIFQRINAVMTKVTYIQKDANVQGYKAVTHDQVTSVLRQAMVDQGIVLTTKVLESRSVPTGNKTSSGREFIRYEARYAIYFVNIDDPKDTVEVVTEAHAEDTGDKAPGKAISYAVKYAMLKTFSLETGENDESRTTVEGDKPITGPMLKALSDKMAATNTKETEFSEYLKKCLGHDGELSDLTVSQYNFALGALIKKEQKNGTAQH